MGFLSKIAKLLAPIALDWAMKHVVKWGKGVIEYIKYSKKEREIIKRKYKRDELVKEIEAAEKEGDREKLEKLYVSLHILDSDK